jgi:hypothetical protein
MRHQKTEIYQLVITRWNTFKFGLCRDTQKCSLVRYVNCNIIRFCFLFHLLLNNSNNQIKQIPMMNIYIRAVHIEVTYLVTLVRYICFNLDYYIIFEFQSDEDDHMNFC